MPRLRAPKLGSWVQISVTVSLICFLHSCASQSKKVADYTIDGQQFGVTAGSFRGRWWNHYERGRSYADGEFWPEAEEDFRLCLRARNRDQLWARTYGLHLLQEYFPHREFGIVLYQAGDLENAIKELETSLDQTPSARAAFYLELAYRAQIGDVADVVPPTISILSPSSARPYGQTNLNLIADVADNFYVDSVIVNGAPYELPYGSKTRRLEKEIVLQPGLNAVVISSLDLAGNEGRASIDVVVDVDGPALSFDQSGMAGQVIRGSATDRSTVSQITIGDIPARIVSSDSDHALQFEVSVVPNTDLSAVAYEAIDEHGNVTRGETNLIQTIGNAVLRESTFRSRGVWPVFASANSKPLSANYASDPVNVHRSSGIRFTNVREGQEYVMSEINVGLDLLGSQPFRTVELNGIEIPFLAGKSSQFLSRTINLKPGINTIVAKVEDESGRQMSESVTISREEAAHERSDNLLSVAFVSMIHTGNTPKVAEESDKMLNSFDQNLRERNRFNFKNRQLEVLTLELQEMELSELLSSSDGVIRIGESMASDLMLVGRMHRDASSVEVIVEAISPESAIRVARAEVAGFAEDEQALEALARDLAIRFTQEFPRRSGIVAKVRKRSSERENVVRRVRLGIPSNIWLQASPDRETEVLLVIDLLKRELNVSDQITYVELDQEAPRALESRLGKISRQSKRKTQPIETMVDLILVGGMTGTNDNTTVTWEIQQTESPAVPVVSQSKRSHTVEGSSQNSETIRSLAREVANAILETTPTEITVEEDVTFGMIESDLNELQLVKESMKYLIFREDDPVRDPRTNELLGIPTIEVGEGLVLRVRRNKSVADILERDRQIEIKPGDIVVTK